MIVFKDSPYGLERHLDLQTIQDLSFYQKNGSSIIYVQFKDGSTRKWGTHEYHEEYRAEYERIFEYHEYFLDSGYDKDKYEMAKKGLKYENYYG